MDKKKTLGNKSKSQILTATLAFIIFLTATPIFGFAILKRRYPLTYRDYVLSSAEEFNLNAALIFAIIKTESSFISDAVSPKGAKGLMQLTDETGAYVAKMLNETNYNLFDAQTNIRFGCKYLRYLINVFGITKTAITAYNAGEGNVKNWLKDKRFSNDKTTLFAIPFSETEAYLKKIYKTFRKYEKIYGKLLDKKQKS